MIKTKPLFKQVRCPVLIVQGSLDDTVQYRSDDYIYSSVLSQQKMIKYYNNSNHIICQSNDNYEVFNDIFMFIMENIIN